MASYRRARQRDEEEAAAQRQADELYGPNREARAANLRTFLRGMEAQLAAEVEARDDIYKKLLAGGYGVTRTDTWKYIEDVEQSVKLMNDAEDQLAALEGRQAQNIREPSLPHSQGDYPPGPLQRGEKYHRPDVYPKRTLLEARRQQSQPRRSSSPAYVRRSGLSSYYYQQPRDPRTGRFKSVSAPSTRYRVI